MGDFSVFFLTWLHVFVTQHSYVVQWRVPSVVQLGSEAVNRVRQFFAFHHFDSPCTHDISHRVSSAFRARHPPAFSFSCSTESCTIRSCMMSLPLTFKVNTEQNIEGSPLCFPNVAITTISTHNKWICATLTLRRWFNLLQLLCE